MAISVLINEDRVLYSLFSLCLVSLSVYLFAILFFILPWLNSQVGVSISEMNSTICILQLILLLSFCILYLSSCGRFSIVNTLLCFSIDASVHPSAVNRFELEWIGQVPLPNHPQFELIGVNMQICCKWICMGIFR